MSTFLTRPGLSRRALAGASAGLMVSAAVLGGSAATSAQATARATAKAGSVDTVHVVNTFGPRNEVFVESVVVDSRGTAYTSRTRWGRVNAGRIVAFTASGRKIAYGPRMALGATGLLTGVAVDGRDHLYVARVDVDPSKPSFVLRVTRTGVRRVATLPPDAFPNGLAFHRGRLYVGDSALGAVWRVDPSRQVRPSTPWLRHRLLRPAGPEELGVNGLAFWRDTLFAVNSSKGLLVSVGTGGDGRPAPRLVRRTHRLLTADGIDVDARGHLWVVTNGVGEFNESGTPPHGQRLLLMTRSGAIWDTTTDAPWMSYPTDVARGRAPATANRMLATNGAFYGGAPTLVSFRLR